MKKWINYCKLFWYFASNWNPRLALFLLYHEIRGENKYDLNTSVPIELDKLTIRKGDTKNSSRYEGVNYYILETLLQKLRTFTDADTFVDLGCGKGRAMVVAAYYGFTEIKGVDFAEEVCVEARINMERLQQQRTCNYSVVCANVLDYDIQPNDTVFFMFNPFTRETISAFLAKLEESCLQHPRDIYFLYASPRYAEALFEYEFEPIYRKRKLKWLDGTILKREAV